MTNTDKNNVTPWGLVMILLVLHLLTVGWLNYGNYRGAVAEGVGGSTLFWMLAGNTLILSIPVGALYFSIGVLLTAARQRRSDGRISRRLAKFIYWTPRIAGILISIFVGLFALDVFSEGGNILQMLGAFILHAAPAILMGVIVALAWRRAQIGFVAFALIAVAFLGFLQRNSGDALGFIMLFSAPMALIALLFWANWKWQIG